MKAKALAKTPSAPAVGGGRAGGGGKPAVAAAVAPLIPVPSDRDKLVVTHAHLGWHTTARKSLVSSVPRMLLGQHLVGFWD